MGKSTKRKNSRKYRKRVTLRNRKSKGGVRTGAVRLAARIAAAATRTAARAPTMPAVAGRTVPKIVSASSVGPAPPVGPVSSVGPVSPVGLASSVGPVSSVGPAPPVGPASLNGMMQSLARAEIYTFKDELNKRNVLAEHKLDGKFAENLKIMETENLKNLIEKVADEVAEKVAEKTIERIKTLNAALDSEKMLKRQQTTKEEMFKSIASTLKTVRSDISNGKGETFANVAEGVNFMFNGTNVYLIGRIINNALRKIFILATFCFLVYGRIKQKKSDLPELTHKEAFMMTLEEFKDEIKASIGGP